MVVEGWGGREAGRGLRTRDREAEGGGVGGEEALQEGGFADARGAGDHDRAVLLGGFEWLVGVS